MHGGPGAQALTSLGSQKGPHPPMALLVPLILLAVMYLLLIRPQQQRVRRQRDLVRTLDVGDRIVTIGGVLGTIVTLDEDTAEVEIADGVVVEFMRPAISRKVEEGPGALPSTGSDGNLDGVDDVDGV